MVHHGWIVLFHAPSAQISVWAMQINQMLTFPCKTFDDQNVLCILWFAVYTVSIVIWIPPK